MTLIVFPLLNPPIMISIFTDKFETLFMNSSNSSAYLLFAIREYVIIKITIFFQNIFRINFHFILTIMS